MRLASVLRPGEEPLWLGKSAALGGAVSGRGSFLTRLFRKAPQSTPTSSTLYAITPSRVLAITPDGSCCEWFLMLGMIQQVDEHADGSGSIIFDYEEDAGSNIPRGIIGIPAVAQVRNLLADAIDAAYNASPWSV